jgi:hypothetical protein
MSFLSELVSVKRVRERCQPCGISIMSWENTKINDVSCVKGAFHECETVFSLERFSKMMSRREKNVDGGRGREGK